MLEKFLNKKVAIWVSLYGSANGYIKKGIMTSYNEEYIELDNEKIIAIRFIASIELA